MPIQTIDRGTAGNTGDTFKVGVAFDTCQANDEYLDLVKPTIIETFSALATTAAPTAGMVVYIKQHTSGGLGGGFFQDTAGTITNNGGTLINNTITSGRHWKRINYNGLTIAMFGAVLDGTTADDTAWDLAIAAAAELGEILYVPPSELGTKITSTKTITQNVPIIGLASGALVSQYLGRQGGGARILFTGSGACFQVDPNPTPGSTVRLPYGQRFKDIIIENEAGNTAATHGIKVSDESNINVAGMDLAGFSIESVFIYGFKNGRALEINYCFNNNISNFIAETCGVCCSLNYAHGTVFIGGSLEQSLVGLDARVSFDVTLQGTVLQGINTSRIASQGLSVPTDFFIWAGGWDGTGANGISRTVAADYAGVGVRVFGSQVKWFGGYEEGNSVGYLLELDSAVDLFSKYVDLDLPARYWIQIGIGSLGVFSPTFVQGAGVNFVSVIHTERNYAAPCTVINPGFATTVPLAKHFTGYTTSNAGMIHRWNPNVFRNTFDYYSSDVNVNGGLISHGGYRNLSGFNRDYRETLSPASTGTLTKDISSGTTGTNILHLANAATITVTFTDTDRAVAGTPLRVTIINAGGSDTTLTFSTTYFRTGSASYTLATNTQRVFVFFFENGLWLEENATLTL